MIKKLKKIRFSGTKQPVSLSPKYKCFSVCIYQKKYNFTNIFKVNVTWFSGEPYRTIMVLLPIFSFFMLMTKMLIMCMENVDGH